MVIYLPFPLFIGKTFTMFAIIKCKNSVNACFLHKIRGKYINNQSHKKGKMEFNTLSGKVTFIEERDFRNKFLEEKGLFPYLCTKVLINGKPLSTRTARKAFAVEEFSELSKNSLAIWLESETLIAKVLKEENTYATK